MINVDITNYTTITWNSVNYSGGLISNDGELSLFYPTGLAGCYYKSTSNSSGYYSKFHNLSNVIIGENVKRIPNNFCWQAYNVKSVILPQNVTDIGCDAFLKCDAAIYIKNPTPPTVTSNSFDSNKTIYVPISSVNAYKEAWANYSYNVVGYYFAE